MCYCLPARVAQPLTRLIDAVNVRATGRQEELPSHKRCENRLLVCRVGPKIHEQYSSSGRRMPSHPAEELHDSIDGEAVHDVRDDHCVMALGKRVCEKIARVNKGSALRFLALANA
jgi:hypothetical protein